MWKNGISYAVGLMRSIAYRRIHLVNKKTAIVAKMTPHVGINSKREAGEYVRYPFLVILLGCVTVRLRVLHTVGNTNQNHTHYRQIIPFPPFRRCRHNENTTHE